MRPVAMKRTQERRDEFLFPFQKREKGKQKRGESLQTLSAKEVPGQKPSATFLRNAEFLIVGMYSSAVVVVVVLGFPIAVVPVPVLQRKSISQKEKRTSTKKKKRGVTD